jgi:hypothetical protein
MMKVIVAGSRDINDLGLVRRAMQDSGFDITEVVSGKARGVDSLGETAAVLDRIPVKEFPADWAKYKRRAGPLRNIQMGDYAEALVAIRLNGSRGTTHMIEYMRKLGKPVYVVDVSTYDQRDV